ncbi:MAG: hypothetical protein U0941_00155 [Planctomycetaceae bacterium]
MKKDDPTPTYRGYRRQALYVLSRLFDDAIADDSIIEPEGLEDLAIRSSDGQLIEVVQVKDLTANLVASSFSRFFYERTSPHCSKGSTVTVRVASFGPIGPDLLDANSGNLTAVERVVKTIAKDRETGRKRRDGTVEKIVVHGLPETLARRFIEHVQLTSVNEPELTQSIKSSISRSVAEVSPDEAFSILMWWIVTSSETKASISRREAIQKLSSIGNFLSGRAAFHSEWNQSIIPLDESAVIGFSERDSLKNQFFRGGRVEFRHILADVDVVRDVPLTALHGAFDESNVVILHAASGQGKTTLALRYLKEFAPTAFRLQLKTADDLRHARRMALAIRDQTTAIGVPTIVYVDVRPGDSHWTELVRELASQSLIRVLVTIREEDWQRTGRSLDVLFAESDVTFDEQEAREIYQSLREQGLEKDHLDFEEAWGQFGARKCLLEFVYFVTQAETLATRIESQVHAFQEEVRSGASNSREEQLLRLVAVASAYEGRLDLARTVLHCGVTSPQATLRRFEDEYFVRESYDGRLLDGFHAIRSEVLCECLTDRTLFPWEEFAAEAIPLMEESDLEAFLLYAFSRRRDSVPRLQESLRGFTPKTWRGMCGVMRALMWLGLRQYWDLNRDVVDEAFAQFPGGWSLLFDVDVARSLSSDDWDIFANLGESGKVASERRTEFRKRQVDRDVIFKPVTEWLASVGSEMPQVCDPFDWLSLAEVAYWSGHLRIPAPWAENIDPQLIALATQNLSLFRFGEFVCGIRFLVPDVVRSWWADHRERFVESLRRGAAIAKWEETDDAIIAHYVIDLELKATQLVRGDQSDASESPSLHDLSIERIELLHNLIDGKQKYGAVGYGHRITLCEMPFDEADKSGVLSKYLHPVWGPNFNSLSRGCSEYQFRPKSWHEFFDKLNSQRELFLACMTDLRGAIRHSRLNPGQPVVPDANCWSECHTFFQAPLLFPKIAVDEWGFVADSSSKSNSAPAPAQRRRPGARFPIFLKALNDYRRAISNFLNQALGALITAPALRQSGKPSQREQVLKLAEQIGTNEHTIRQSILNGFAACAAFRQLHAAFEESKELHDWRSIPLELRECQEIDAAMDDFAAYVFPPEQRHMKLAYGRYEPFAWVLRPLRGRLENRLQRLNRHNVKATILPDIIIWNGKPGLWIVADAIHPIVGTHATKLIWDAIKRAFDADTANPVQWSVTEYAWEEIVLVLTTKGRAYDQVAYRHFRSAAFDERSFEQVPWAGFAEQVPNDIWSQTGIHIWDKSPAQSSMDQAVASYFVLMQHIQHMADLARIPETDDLGTSIVQQYLFREEKRVEPILQAMFDSFSEVLQVCSTLGDFDNNPNLLQAVQALIELKDAILLQPNSEVEAEQPMTHQLTLRQMVDWRDRLMNGMQILSLARLFLIAHALRCPVLQ